MRISRITLAAICILALTISVPVLAQNAESLSVDLNLRADQQGGLINKNIYGQFAEHLGRCIYDGLWVGEDSPIPNTGGIRTDVLNALKELHVPVLRWPGGCFADEYHWRDAIGPRAERPRRLNTSWGNVIETNAFGTHEFMDLCEAIGADAYLCGNVGSGTPQEMMEWIEYITSDSDSTLANERRKNGRDEPWKLPFFAVGNESWGCGGNMTPEQYADEYMRFSTFVKNLSGNRIQRIACGADTANFNWTEVVMGRAAGRMQGISLHFYTLPTSSWQRKGQGANFNEAQWFATMERTLRMDDLITRHSAIMDQSDRNGRVALIVDEWGTWYDATPGQSLLWQPNTLRDAVVAGVNFAIFHKHNGRVKMANIAQLTNVLQAMILTDGDKMVLTPTYHVFKMYAVHQDATYVPIEFTSPQYTQDNSSLPALSATASRDSAGKLRISLVNIDPNRAMTLTTKLTGATGSGVTGQIITADEMTAANTVDNLNAVKAETFGGAKFDNGQLIVELPAKSVVTLEIQ